MSSVLGWIILVAAIVIGVKLAQARLGRTTIHTHITYTQPAPPPEQIHVPYPVFIPSTRDDTAPIQFRSDTGEPGIRDSDLHGLIADYHRDNRHP